jgi:hypothetical protein
VLLTEAQIRELTDRRHHDAQQRALDRMGIPYRVRPDGSLVVLRAVVELLIGMPAANIAEPEPEVQP